MTGSNEYGKAEAHPDFFGGGGGKGGEGADSEVVYKSYFILKIIS